MRPPRRSGCFQLSVDINRHPSPHAANSSHQLVTSTDANCSADVTMLVDETEKLPSTPLRQIARPRAGNATQSRSAISRVHRFASFVRHFETLGDSCWKTPVHKHHAQFGQA